MEMSIIFQNSIIAIVEFFHCNEYLAQFLGLFVYGAVNFLSNKIITFR